MTIALVSALAIGEFFTALVITAFVLAAEILEGLTVGRGRRAIQDMLDFLPQIASVVRNGKIVEVDTHTIRSRRNCADSARRTNPRGWTGVERPFLCGTGSDHRRADAERKVDRQRGLRRHDQSGRHASGSRRSSGQRNDLRQDHRGGRESRTFARSDPEDCGPARRIPGLFCSRRGGAHLPHHPQHPIHDLGHHRCRGLRHRCGNTARHPRERSDVLRYTARSSRAAVYFEALGQLDTVFLDKTGTLTYGIPFVTEIHACARDLGAEYCSKQPPALKETRSILLVAPSSVMRSNRRFTVAEPEHFEYRIGRGVLASLRRRTRLSVGNRALFEELGIALPATSHALLTGREILVARGGLYLGSVLVTDQLRPSAARGKGSKRHEYQGVLVDRRHGATAEAIADQLGIVQVYSELLPSKRLPLLLSK